MQEEDKMMSAYWCKRSLLGNLCVVIECLLSEPAAMAVIVEALATQSEWSLDEGDSSQQMACCIYISNP